MISTLHEPNEKPSPQHDDRLRNDERSIVGGLLITVPAILLALAPVMRPLFRMLIDLKPVPLEWSWSGLTSLSLLPAIASFIILGAWYGWLRWSSDRHAGGVAFVAIAFALGLQLLVAVVWNHPRILAYLNRASAVRMESHFTSWAGLEWLYQERFEPPRNEGAKLAIVGSSQIKAAVDHESLRTQVPSAAIVVRAMPAFSVSQYLPAGERIADGGGTHLFCWISELDMFRAEGLPVDRLRFLVDVPTTIDVAATLEPRMAWESRASLADLFASAMLPQWRDRDLVAVTVLRTWFPAPPDEGRDQSQTVLIGNHVRRTSMTEFNFEVFEAFARRMQERNVRLHVFEGVANLGRSPQLDRYRHETRERMRAMAATHQFEYVEASEMPQFHADDWEDLLHLGPSGREKFTSFVSERMERRFPVLEFRAGSADAPSAGEAAPSRP